MPPSGFSRDQSRPVIEYLLSCSQALRSEGVPLGRPPRVALEAEIDTMVDALTKGYGDSFIRPLLSLTMDFYQRVHDAKPEDWDHFDLVVQKVLGQLETSVLAVQV